MRHLRLACAALLVVVLSGCRDTTEAPLPPPAAPRGVSSVNGDGQVTLYWLANTEGDVVGYRVYEASCPSGSNCPYSRIGTTNGTSFVVSGLSNGQTRYFAVSAVSTSGAESDLSYDTIFDTPRPAGTGAVIGNYLQGTSNAGWDFSTARVVASTDTTADVIYGFDGTYHIMYAADLNTDIQDAGYATTLDAVAWAPTSGWSPTGTAELIPGHCYVVWTRDNHFAKFRVTSLTATDVTFDWAYQTDPGNPQLRAHRTQGITAGAFLPGPAIR